MHIVHKALMAYKRITNKAFDENIRSQMNCMHSRDFKAWDKAELQGKKNMLKAHVKGLIAHDRILTGRG